MFRHETAPSATGGVQRSPSVGFLYFWTMCCKKMRVNHGKSATFFWHDHWCLESDFTLALAMFFIISMFSSSFWMFSIISLDHVPEFDISWPIDTHMVVCIGIVQKVVEMGWLLSSALDRMNLNDACQPGIQYSWFCGSSSQTIYLCAYLANIYMLHAYRWRATDMTSQPQFDFSAWLSQRDCSSLELLILIMTKEKTPEI